MNATYNPVELQKKRRTKFHSKKSCKTLCAAMVQVISQKLHPENLL